MRNALMFILTLFGASVCIGADVYPSKPVRVIVHVTLGGIQDLVARAISRQLEMQSGKPFMVENRADPTGTVAGGLVAKSTPDGYTLLLASNVMTLYPALGRTMPYDVARDFTPVTKIADSPTVLVVQPALNVTNLKEFISLAQANTENLNYGSTAFGGTVHLVSELFKIRAKINVARVPFKSNSALITAMLGNQIQMTFGSVPSLLNHIESGKLRAVAVTTDGKRLTALPDVPSMSEAGLSGMAVYYWYGLAGPAGMPKEVVNKLHSEVVKAIASMTNRIVEMGADPVGSSPEEFSTHIRSELQLWDGVIKSAGLQRQQK